MLQAQSTGEDSNSSDTVASDAGDTNDVLNGSLDHSRTPTFPNSFLGLQNIPGLLPGPSSMNDNFGELKRNFFAPFFNFPFFNLTHCKIAFLLTNSINLKHFIFYVCNVDIKQWYAFNWRDIERDEIALFLPNSSAHH